MINRRISPFATWLSLWVTASRCQFRLNGIPGRTTPKANSVNAVRSSASSACRTRSGLISAPVASLIASLSLPAGRRVVVIQQLGGREDGARAQKKPSAFAVRHRRRGWPDDPRREFRRALSLMLKDSDPSLSAIQKTSRRACRSPLANCTASCCMPAPHMVRSRCRSPWVTVTFWLKARSNNCFEVGEERRLLSLGALGVAALSRLELVLFWGPAWTDLVLRLRGTRREGIVAPVGRGIRARCLNLCLACHPTPHSGRSCRSRPFELLLARPACASLPLRVARTDRAHARRRSSRSRRELHLAG